MKFLSCRDVCDHDCDYIAQGDTEREVIRVLFYHGKIEHKETLDDLNEKQRQKIVTKMREILERAESIH